MFHVSTMLPYKPKDPQQIERKRFIGNDIVVIIFCDGKTLFDPSKMNSEYNQCYIIVRAEKEPIQVVKYYLEDDLTIPPSPTKDDATLDLPPSPVGDTPSPPRIISKNSPKGSPMIRKKKKNVIPSTKYRVGMLVRDTLEDFFPDILEPPLYENKTVLRNFLIGESIATIRTALKSPNTTFQKKIVAFRTISLNTILQKYLGE